jgi:Outer membrane protein beta-barrel domain
MHNRRAIAVATITLMLGARAAFADATAFIGATTTPANHLAKGFAVGTGLVIVGFEFEYSSTSEDPAAGAPSLKSGSGNVLLQSPFSSFQPYVTTGLSVYRETLTAIRHQQTGLAPNLGVGLKMGLLGPVNLRVDYRVFKLGSGALYSPAHRVYVGLNLKF